ncbi:uncharacterized protein LOC128711587 [Anopheles marshallii]|uniref:uncharacterized protein LOC128711587 n=1 Tax=Anopheles marshallii TaxID=1521116 RepID=UPI00237B706B|nr:uncharacterized protein LOC128711587 [Anopheles marshallii]
MSAPGPQPPSEITAEWTVHAQLTLSSIAPATFISTNNSRLPSDVPPTSTAEGCSEGQASTSEYNISPPGAQEAGVDLNVTAPQNFIISPTPTPPASSSSAVGSPVKVVYKFSTTDHPLQQKQTSMCSAVPVGGKSSVIFNTDPSSPSTPVTLAKTPTGVGPPPPCSENAVQLFPKCTSTCSIVLTACTDLVPTTDTLPITVNKCESTNNIVVDKCTNFPEKSASNSKDVSCQTSDWETNKKEDKNGATGFVKHQGVTQKTTTDGCLLSPPPRRREDRLDSHVLKSISPLIDSLVSPSNTIRSQQSSVRDTSVTKKKPRTVHIDVYCTGSDAESESDCGSCCSFNEGTKSLSSSGAPSAASSNSSVSSGSRFDTSHMMELKAAAYSNIDPSHPTVYESEEIRVRHKRAGKHEVPRRLMQQTIDQNTLSTIGSLKRIGSARHGRSRRNTATDEISESKKILFSKHLGEVPQQQNEEHIHGAFSTYFRRDISDDAISSNYALSADRSTRRDVTGSSLSSAFACGGFYEDKEDSEMHSKLNRSGTTATQSDSFEYDNSEDRYRIHEMERVWKQHHWKSPSLERKLLQIQNSKLPSSSCHSPESEHNLTESDHSFVYDEAPHPNASNPSLNEYSDSSPSTVKSASQRASEKPNQSILLQQQAVLAATLQYKREFSPVEGYTNEYLAIARRFGSLITSRRKPGTHMGPVRNPECPCEHCRRWVLERDSGGSVSVLRERALSMDGTSAPNGIVDMRRQFHQRNTYVHET